MDRRVVITGMGIYSVLGKNIEVVNNSLYRGVSGIGLDLNRKEYGFRSLLTGIIERPDLRTELKRRERIGMPEQAEYAYMATKEALSNAKLDEDFMKKNEVGILFGNDSSAVPVIESIDKVRNTQDTSRVGSGAIFKCMNSTITMNLAVIFKLKGINTTISGACASSSHAIGFGYLMIKHGYQDMIICGGAQEVNPESMASFDGLGAFSINHEHPTLASKPFDKSRDGFIPSGGGASIVIESLESAKRRGANIIAEVKGYGFSSNGEHISIPNVIGPEIAMKRSIKDAGLTPRDIDYVNAHATSTQVGDYNEAKALVAVFGENGVPISSTKGMTGHEMWMCGASEVVYSTLMMNHSYIAPNINFENPDEASSKLNIIKETKNANIDSFLSNSFGFGGTNSALVISKYKE